MTKHRRTVQHAAILATVALACALGGAARAEGVCGSLFVTGYSSAAFPGTTASGVGTRGREWTILAAHPRFPFGHVISLDGLGSFTVADRGMLGPDHVDVLVYSAAEAFALTGVRGACW